MKVNTAASNQQIDGKPIWAFMTQFFCMIWLLFPTFSSAATFNLATGWNLVGNSSATPIDVATAFGDASKITTVWKWNRSANRWAFYTPSMSAAALLSYTQTKGYDVLASIDSKEGFWVNAASNVDVVGPAGGSVNLTEMDIVLGWNLLGSADGKTPSQLNAALSGSLNSADKAMTTIWAWDTSTPQWRFYAPALEAQGGAVLSDYQAAKGYLPFSAALSLTDGYWVNASAVAVTGNAAPVANAGVAQNVVAGSVVTLDGSASSDANSDPLTYAWTLTSKPAGSTAALSSATSAKPTFTADVAGTYVASLTVNDGKVNSTTVTVSITAAVANVAPVAKAGTDQIVSRGTLVSLRGSGSDANGDSLTYSWSLTSKPAGSSAVLNAQFNLFTADIDGTYVATLIVNDGKVNSAPSVVTITVPTANIAALPLGTGTIAFKSFSNSPYLLNESTGTYSPLAITCSGYSAADLKPNGTVVAVSASNLTVDEVDLLTGACRTLFAVPESMRAIAVSADGTVVTISNASYFGAVQIYRFSSSGVLLSKVTASGLSGITGIVDFSTPTAIDFAPDGNLYALRLGSIWLLDATTGVGTLKAINIAGQTDIDIDNTGTLRTIDFGTLKLISTTTWAVISSRVLEQDVFAFTPLVHR